MVLNLITTRPDLVKSGAVHEPGPLAVLEASGKPRTLELIDNDKRHISHVLDLIAHGEHRRAAQVFLDEVAVGPGAWDASPDEVKTTLASNAATVADDLRDSFDLETVDTAALTSSTVPLLISTGSASTGLEGLAAREMARRIPTARLETLAGAGHIPHRTHPEEYVRMLKAFIERVIGSSSADASG